MDFYSIDAETREVSEIVEPRTLNNLKRCAAIAISRWLLAGTDCPDYRSSDGVSEFEAALLW